MDARLARLPGGLPAPLLRAGPLLLAGVLTVLAWPVLDTAARIGIDGSWQLALQLAAALRLRPGVDIVFTYGPLGFLGYPVPYVGFTSALALLATIALHVALTATMFVEARRILPTWAAFVVTLLVARFFASFQRWEAFQVLAFLWCVEILAGRMRWSTPTLAAIAGALAGVAMLGKINVGIVVLLMGAVTLTFAGRPWWKGLAVYVMAAVGSGLGLFLVSGGQLGDVGAYALGAYQTIAGYNDAMGGSAATSARDWVYPAMALAGGVLVWAGWTTSRDWPMVRRIGLAVLGLVFGFALWKAAVVREHAWIVLGSVVISLFALAPRIDHRTWLALVLAIGLAFAGSTDTSGTAYLGVIDSTRSIVNEVKDAFIPGRGGPAAERTRAALRRQYQIDPATLAAIGSETVHIDPYMTGVAEAYPQLHWEPVPVFQSYAAFTPQLDTLDADLLRSASAPQRILRGFVAVTHNDALRARIGRAPLDSEVFPMTIDGRFRWFESPAQMLETFCRYTQTSATDTWQVLARTARTCGAPEALVTVSATGGESVTVPTETRPDRFVVVRIHGLEPTLLGRIRAALLVGRVWQVVLDGTRYRLIPATAGEGLLLAVPPVADGTGRFAFGAPIRTITVTGAKVPLTFEFLSVPLRLP